MSVEASKYKMKKKEVKIKGREEVETLSSIREKIANLYISEEEFEDTFAAMSEVTKTYLSDEISLAGEYDLVFLKDDIHLTQDKEAYFLPSIVVKGVPMSGERRRRLSDEEKHLLETLKVEDLTKDDIYIAQLGESVSLEATTPSLVDLHKHVENDYDYETFVFELAKATFQAFTYYNRDFIHYIYFVSGNTIIKLNGLRLLILDIAETYEKPEVIHMVN